MEEGLSSIFMCSASAKYRCQLYPQTELYSGSGAQRAHNPDLRIRGPFGFGDQVADPKPPQAAVVKSRGGERCGKVGAKIPAGMVERGERKRTADEVSKAC
jgi:hypothetical protein